MRGPGRRLKVSALGGYWLLLLSAFWLCPRSTARAQDTAPRLQLLQSGDRAPRTGFLIAEEDMVWFRQRISELEFRLGLEARTAQERCDVQLELQRELTRAAEDRQSVIVAAHEVNEAALARQIEEERAEVRRATRAQHAWFRSPVLWFSVGVISAGSLAIALR